MATRAWRLVEALEWGRQHLEKRGIEKARFESQLLLGHVLNRGQDYLYLNPEELLPAEGLSSFRNLVERRKERIPWQYLTGHTEFMSLDFVVNEEVLIPRPETELLVEAALKRLSAMPARRYFGGACPPRLCGRDYQLPTVIDVGTGCGNIVITLAKALSCRAYALDISKTALEVAGVNAKRWDVDKSITFLPEDIFALRKLEDLEEKVDLVISNPPYVPTRELGRLQPEVSRFEPRVALDGGEDGLKFYPPLIEGAAILLHQGGYLALEVGINQAEVVKQLIIEKNQFNCPEIIKDYAGIERVIIARKQ